MAFISLEDGTGEIEIILFSQVYAKMGYLINTEAPVCISGTVSQKDDEFRLICNDIIPLIDNEHIINTVSIPIPERKTSAAAQKPSYSPSKPSPTTAVRQPPKQKKLYVKLDTSDTALYNRLLCYFEIFSGEVPVVLYDTPQKAYNMNTGIFVSGSAMMLSELKELLGEDSVVLK